MKLGIEGRPEDIKNFIEVMGSKSDDLFLRHQPQLKLRWVIIPVLIVGLAIIFLVSTFSMKWFLLGFGGGIWLTTSVQIRWSNTLATSVIGIGIPLLLLIAAGLIPPEKAIKILQGFSE